MVTLLFKNTLRKLTRYIVTVIVVCSTGPLNAQAFPGGMDMAEMQKHAAKMEQCMSSITQADIDKLEKMGKDFEQKIHALCKAGKREEAKSEALSIADKIRKDPTVNKVRECTQGLTGMMADMMPQPPSPEKFEVGRDEHICD